jgi:voltage-gated potassium channel
MIDSDHHPPTEEVTTFLKLTGFDLLLFALTIISCINLVLLVLTRNTDDRNVVLIVDGVIALFFLADFVRRLLRAADRGAYVIRGGGWLDLLAGIPAPGFRIARMGRMYQATKQLRKHGPMKVLQEGGIERSTFALMTAIFFTICVVEFGSMWVLRPESRSETANITSAGDALWWSYVTITTVGYGDQFPVTTRGRIVGFVLMSIGVALFAVITGFLANAFVSPRAQRRAQERRAEQHSEEIRQLRSAVESLAEEVRLLREKDNSRQNEELPLS